tara:strand:- start:697 stop:1272 length:576 start_codon:yes stop_codon:yes gene_type:complete
VDEYEIFVINTEMSNSWIKKVYEKIVLIPATPDEKDLLKKWFSLPHIRRWWHDGWSEKVYDGVSNNYQNLEIDQTFIVSLDGEYIGMAQVYSELENGTTYLNAGEQGIRFMIGETRYLNKKIGRSIVKALAVKIFESASIERIICEPEVDNWAAIITLKRSGFRDQGKVKRPGRNVMRLSLVRHLFLSKTN